MENFFEYLVKMTGATTIKEMIEGLDIPNSTMSRYINGERKMPVSVLIDLAEKYNFSIIDGMVAAGFISKSQAQREKDRYGLSTTSDKDLTNEILRRLEAVSPSIVQDDIFSVGDQDDFDLTANRHDDGEQKGVDFIDD